MIDKIDFQENNNMKWKSPFAGLDPKWWYRSLKPKKEKICIKCGNKFYEKTKTKCVKCS